MPFWRQTDGLDCKSQETRPKGFHGENDSLSYYQRGSLENSSRRERACRTIKNSLGGGF